MKRIRVIVSFIIAFCMFTNYSYGFELIIDKPMAHKSQVIQFLNDRNASDKFLDCVDYIYEYCDKVGIDPTIVIAMSSIETGYGKSNLFVNYNNPGGIKSKNGWKRSDTIKDGYKYMINLLGVYSGKIYSTSWLYDKAHTTQELGNYYWVENGCDRGYHNLLTKVINTILSYDIQEDIVEEKKENIKSIPENKNVKDKILEIINRNKSNNGRKLLEKYMSGLIVAIVGVFCR